MLPALYCISDAKASLPLEFLCGSLKDHETKAQCDNRDHGESGDYLKQVNDRDVIILGGHAIFRRVVLKWPKTRDMVLRRDSSNTSVAVRSANYDLSLLCIE
jgi:hypothetical protein